MTSELLDGVLALEQALTSTRAALLHGPGSGDSPTHGSQGKRSLASGQGSDSNERVFIAYERFAQLVAT